MVLRWFSGAVPVPKPAHEAKVTRNERRGLPNSEKSRPAALRRLFSTRNLGVLCENVPIVRHRRSRWKLIPDATRPEDWKTVALGPDNQRTHPSKGARLVAKPPGAQLRSSSGQRNERKQRAVPGGCGVVERSGSRVQLLAFADDWKAVQRDRQRQLLALGCFKRGHLCSRCRILRIDFCYACSQVQRLLSLARGKPRRGAAGGDEGPACRLSAPDIAPGTGV